MCMYQHRKISKLLEYSVIIKGPHRVIRAPDFLSFSLYLYYKHGWESKLRPEVSVLRPRDARSSSLLCFRVVQKPSFLSNGKIDISHKIFWTFRSKASWKSKNETFKPFRVGLLASKFWHIPYYTATDLNHPTLRWGVLKLRWQDEVARNGGTGNVDDMHTFFYTSKRILSPMSTR